MCQSSRAMLIAVGYAWSMQLLEPLPQHRGHACTSIYGQGVSGYDSSPSSLLSVIVLRATQLRASIQLSISPP
jgi:hypothetical protein